MAESTVTIQTVARDVIRVNFGVAIAITDDLLDVENYAISPILPETSPIEAVSVLLGEFEDDQTTFVDVEISKADLDAVYQLTVSNLYNKDQLSLSGQISNFVGRFTKSDSMMKSIAQMYDVKPSSLFRQILTAMALEDERIGGQGDLSPLPLADETTGEAQTFGSGTFGTTTFGG